ncbi:deoxynucleotidyltransferase terminal-interacting protein 2 [Nematolebias whitei]|uniref:deoxynucleotidyltransferase terminal-interacting protein 2 n=1 Tax=Nematolebias whitei TaxID=451745 RepID=UPI001898AB17|nr:deoxynucleotidyltransferase terminal-interacting protein 2 [Nematolebias whitei]
MVATRSGVCSDSSSEINQKMQSSVQATPSTGRKTRSAAKQVGQVQTTLEETRGHLSVTPATSTNKRCTRALRVHSPELPSTPVGSVHEADTSDGGSVCSAVSTTAPPVTRSMRRSRQAGNQENEETSEVESCSFLVSTSKSGLRSSLRRKTAPKSSDSAQAAAGDVKPDLVPEAESCSSAMSESQRVATGKRKPPGARSSAKRQLVESEVSDSDSCASSIIRRVSRRKPCPIPILLDELSESSQTGQQTRSTRRKAAATVDVSEPPVCDSDGFESGPTYSLSTRGKAKTQSEGPKTEDSESEVMGDSSSVGSPQSRGTPSSSRANSGTSNRVDPAPRRSARKRGGNAENAVESAEVSLLNDSRLESTMTADDADCTLLEDHMQTPEGVKQTAVGSSEADTKPENKDATNISEADPHVALSAVCAEEADGECAMTSEDQEEALSAEVKDEDVSDVTMQETVSTLRTDTQPAAEDAAVQSAKYISLLDSSDDDDDDDEELFNEEKEEERQGGPSNMSAASVEGLFMIDKRPGQDADEQYYREEEEATNKTLHQEEEDEEFVDEEEDDDDDESSKILSSCRSFQVKELSSRIDPGIRVKELGGLYISFDGSKSKPVSSSSQKLKEKKNLDEVMKKSVIGPDFEKKDAVPHCSESKQALKLKRRAEREKSTGSGWFDMKAPELTQELKGDLKILKMRGSLDPKRFYKKNDRDGFPKYFQIGTVVDNPADFYHSHVPKKERKRTMVEELLADAEFRRKNKKRYQMVMAEKAAQGAGRRNKKKFQKKLKI